MNLYYVLLLHQVGKFQLPIFMLSILHLSTSTLSMLKLPMLKLTSYIVVDVIYCKWSSFSWPLMFYHTGAVFMLIWCPCSYCPNCYCSCCIWCYRLQLDIIFMIIDVPMLMMCLVWRVVWVDTLSTIVSVVVNLSEKDGPKSLVQW